MKTSTVRLASLIAWAFATTENACPMSDAALAEIESAAVALALAIEQGALHADNIAETSLSIGAEIARVCAEGLAPSPAIDWAAFMGN